MARPTSEHPTELELQILDLLWEAAPRTVREVREGLSESGRTLAHTSVITTLGTMVEKGQLERLESLQGKAYRLRPLEKKEKLSKRMLGDLVNKVFGGSKEALMMSLFDLSDVNEDEVKRIRKMLNQKIREQQS